MEITQRSADICSALADYHRILIMYALAERPHNVNELVTRLGLLQPTVSRHLRILRECNAVAAERRGKCVYYTLADERILEALDLLRAVLTDQMKSQGKVAHIASERPSV